MVYNKRNGFLKDFFNAGGNHPRPKEALNHFKKAFVHPPGFEDLLKDLRPEEGVKKVVLVDGHPRSGKTWSIAKIVEQLIDEHNLSYWTAGMDSLGVFPSRDVTLLQAAEQVSSALKETRGPRIVLLDDFFGTNQLRNPGSALSDQRLRSYLEWNNEENPWLENLSSGSVLIITGRSLHFTLIDVLLDLRIRDVNFPTGQVKVKNPRRGLFRTFEKGLAFGAFDESTLQKASEKNREHHPLSKDKERDWLIMATPLLAFDVGVELSQEQQKDAARILFGEDLVCLANLIREIETSENETLAPGSESFEGWKKRVKDKLYRIYLVLIAPGLLFLDRSAYRSLGIDWEMRNIIVNSLYLNETIDEFCSGRLPNEFYMIAINEYLTGDMVLAARAFAYTVSPPDKPVSSADQIPGIGLRGIIERGLHSHSLAKVKQVKEFDQLVDLYLKEKPDCLLHLEYRESPSNNECKVLMSPGLAASIGWSLYNFFATSPKKVEATVREWFPARFKKYILRFRRDVPADWASDPVAAKVDVSETIPDEDSKWSIVASYSTFLQWVIKMDASPEPGGLLDKIIEISKTSHESVRKELKIVLEDELLWALSESSPKMMKLPDVVSMFKFLDEEATDHDTWTKEEGRLRTNRLFSLAWHNKWNEKREEAFGTRVSNWIERFREPIFDYMKREEGLIDENLQYHWSHFITQRAVWMRDWCFQDNPDEFERSYSQITRGSNNPEDNQLFVRMVSAVLDQRDFTKETIRNLLMLVGTRASRIPDLGRITGKMDRIISAPDAEIKQVRVFILQAIFELARQGYLDSYSECTTEEFRSWCKKKTDDLQDHMAKAWRHYWGGLEKVTHLDLKPRQNNGWEDVLPRGWLQK